MKSALTAALAACTCGGVRPEHPTVPVQPVHLGLPRIRTTVAPDGGKKPHVKNGVKTLERGPP